MPDDFKKCKGIVAAWGVGGDPFYFPPEAGYPVGEEHGGATYYMLEVHYDNPGWYFYLILLIIINSLCIQYSQQNGISTHFHLLK